MRNSFFCLIVLSALVLFSNQAMGEGKIIQTGAKVKFHYTLTVKGEVVDTSEGKEPLEYTHGQNMIIPGLESQMEGLKAGDKKTVIVNPDAAYGQVDEKAKVEFPKANIGIEEDLQEGMLLQLTDPSGRAVPGKVAQIKEDTVVIDFNHPLAGQELQFQVEIVNVE